MTLDHKAMVLQDIDFALKVLESEKYLPINVIANRIMSNATFVKYNHSFLAGIFLKEISVLLLNKRNLQHQEEFEDEAKNWFSVIRELVEKDREVIDYWKFYKEYELTSRKYILPDEEIDSYEKNTSISSEFIDNLIKDLNSNRGNLKKRDNVYIVGILNEITRILNSHTGEEKYYSIYIYFRSLAHLHRYLLLDTIKQKDDIDYDEYSQRVCIYLDRLMKIYDYKNERFLEEISKIIFDIIYEWRQLFQIFLDNKQIHFTQEESRFELPDDIKRDFSEIIMKAFKKELE